MHLKSIIKLWLSLVTGVLPVSVFSQSAFVTMGGSDVDQSYALLQTSDNGYVIAGYTLSYGQSMNITGDVYLIKINSSGTVQWTETVGGASYDEGYGIVQATDGGFVVAGVTYSFGAGNADMYILKFTSAGALSWSKTLGEAAGDEYANAITRGTDGGYVVAGYTTSYGSGDEDIFLAKFTAAGNLSWTRSFGGTGNERANSVITVPDGYIMAGSTDSYGQGSTDLYIVKYNLSGSYQWSQAVGGAGIDEAYDIIQDTDGNLVATGYTSSYGAGIGDMYLIKFDSNGNLLWTSTYGNSLNGWGWQLIQASDGNYVVAGMYVPTGGSGASDAIMVKFDTNGNLLWKKNYGGTNGPEMANGLIENSAGQYVACGNSNSFGGAYDIAVSKITSSGSACTASGATGTVSSGGVASGSSGSNTNRPLAAGNGGVESSGGTLTNQCGNLATLPVELVSFTGKVEGNSSKLSWSTASEENNNFFTIEKSYDGKTFSEIGKIKGAGNSNAIRKYEFTDESPAQQNYYRLSQTDFDGQYKELGIVSVKMLNESNGLQLTVQSNPVTTNNLLLNLFSSVEDEIILNITDLQGRVIRSEKISIGGNENILAAIDLQGMSKGAYFVTATGKSSSVNSKFILLNRD